MAPRPTPEEAARIILVAFKTCQPGDYLSLIDIEPTIFQYCNSPYQNDFMEGLKWLETRGLIEKHAKLWMLTDLGFQRLPGMINKLLSPSS